MILVLELQVNHTSTGSAAGRINQPAYTGFLSKSTNQPCPLWLDRPDSFNFTSTACAFRKQRITVTIPSYNYLITFFEPTSLLRSYQTIWEESHTFLFHGLSGTVSIDRALSRRLNNIHRTLLRAVFWTFYCFTMNTSGWEHRIIIWEMGWLIYHLQTLRSKWESCPLITQCRREWNEIPCFYYYYYNTTHAMQCNELYLKKKSQFDLILL
jgi:hypothetical protein